MKTIGAITVFLVAVSAAQASVYITEYMYSGAPGEYIEFTNLGGSAVDMAGWSYDDDSRLPNQFDLSAFGLVQPGESVIITETIESEFRSAWGLAAGVKIIGGYTNNIGRNDELNLFDSTDSLVDRLTFGDQNFPGSFRTQDISANPMTPAALGANDILQWVASSPGDAFGSYVSLADTIGNPGVYVPEPAMLSMLMVGGVLFLRRR